MNHPAIHIQGNLLSFEILDKLSAEDCKYQHPADYGLNRNARLRDEIGLAWQVAKTYWQAFKLRRSRLSENSTGVSETRAAWIIPLLNELGYTVERSPAEMVQDRSYAISHRAQNLKGFPIHIMGVKDGLDKRRENGGPRLSPHALTQEYLNYTDHLYALVTNGTYLRLLRDATRLVRLSYLEFNLEKMMEEELYSEFAVFYRLLHASRMPDCPQQSEESIIEYYHQESLAAGTRIRERLSEAVEDAIKGLGNGLLQHPDNQPLREAISSGRLSPDQFYLHLLRLIYRLLFLMVIEERNLIYPEEQDPETQRLRDIYYRFYSLQRLKKLASGYQFVDDRKYDLWEGVKTTFLLFENEKIGADLRIQPLGSGLFSAEALGLPGECRLANDVLLKAIGRLTWFENKSGQLTPVNYADLDVEEFGSVYEGLLEYAPNLVVDNWQFNFKKGNGRSSSGAHYTPEELVKPLIEHSLDHLIAEKLQDANPEKALLSLTVCDVACGSGHILLSAARRIGFALARVRTGEEQPAPTALRLAIREVIRHCIYGVDKNPLAVELCKVALWLEAHHPGQPLNFLDHRIKCGDAIVGLARIEELERGIPEEAFKQALPQDDAAVVRLLRNTNKKQRKDRLDRKQLRISAMLPVRTKFEQLSTSLLQIDALQEHTPAQVSQKGQLYRDWQQEAERELLQRLADLQVAPFFLPKLQAADFVTDAEYWEYLEGNGLSSTATAVDLAKKLSEEKRFFHWFLEFPEVFLKGGFDCILGNPPFLGDKKLRGFVGEDYLEWLKFCYYPAGIIDLVGFFCLRTFSILNKKGFLSFISTNTIAQGDTRKGGLEYLLKNGATLNFAIKSQRWPGAADVQISLVGLTARQDVQCFLNNKFVKKISSFLDEDEIALETFKLSGKDNEAFVGVYPNGKGFIIDKREANELLIAEKKNVEVIKPFLTGSELNSSPEHFPSRYAIDFKDWSIETAFTYSKCFALLKDRVKPFRDKLISKKGQIHEYDFWKFWDKRLDKFEMIQNNCKVLVVARVSKTLAFTFVKNINIIGDSVVIFKFEDYRHFAVLQSNFHYHWVWKYCTTMKTDPNYGPSKVFHNFPFPRLEIIDSGENLNQIGEIYHNYRSQLLLDLQLGLTKTYNQFHNPGLQKISGELSLKAIEKQLGKESANLWKHLEKTAGVITYEEAVVRIGKLRDLHREMDKAVLVAYGWHEAGPNGPAIELRHDFYEVDYLPENDRIRYTIHPEARREVLKRLLLLNHELHARECAADLQGKEEKAVEVEVMK